MTPTIFQKDAPVLRKKAAEVPLSDIQSAKIQKVLSGMQVALLTQDDGVALAAPQLGHSLRIFIVSKAALSPLRKGVSESARTGVVEAKQPPKAAPKSSEDKKTAGYMVFINPVITKLSRDKAVVDEGCLSVRPLYGKIKRAKKATITAYDEYGKKFTRGASGLLAQIFQHECDHLEGILFIDRATDVKELTQAKSDS